MTEKLSRNHLLFVFVTTILVLASFLLTLFKPSVVYVKKPFDPVDENTSLLPKIKNDVGFPKFSAKSIYAIDLNSSVVLYEKNPQRKVLPASTTKMLTALVALDYYNFDQVLNTGRFKSTGSSMGLVWNEDISVRDLMYGLLLQSGNDAAEVFALNYPGGRDAFVQAMNKKALQAYASDSNFLNPTGLDEEGQYSTARDLARIASFALKNETFAEIVSTKNYIATNIEGNIKHDLTNRNELLGKVDGVLGVKTGFTYGAQENLVTLVNRDNKKIIIALLGSSDRFGESEQLLEWIYASYNWQSTTR